MKKQETSYKEAAEVLEKCKEFKFQGYTMSEVSEKLGMSKSRVAHRLKMLDTNYLKLDRYSEEDKEEFFDKAKDYRWEGYSRKQAANMIGISVGTLDNVLEEHRVLWVQMPVGEQQAHVEVEGIPRWQRDEEATDNWAKLMKEHHPHMITIQSRPTNVGA